MKYLIAASLLSAAPAVAADVQYDAAGKTFGGYFADAENEKGLVVIVHDWDGLTDYERQRADMLAEMGYDAFAVDVFGVDTPTETVDHRRAATGEAFSDRDRLKDIIAAGLSVAKQSSGAESVLVMGYCFGGSVALEMARSDMAGEAAGYATFHGGLTTPDGQGWDGNEPPVMVYHGAADSSITMADVASFTDELNAAGNTFTVKVYSGAPHAFTVFGTDRYQERADAESWESFSEFLAERLDG